LSRQACIMPSRKATVLHKSSCVHRLSNDDIDNSWFQRRGSKRPLGWEDQSNHPIPPCLLPILNSHIPIWESVVVAVLCCKPWQGVGWELLFSSCYDVQSEKVLIFRDEFLPLPRPPPIGDSVQEYVSSGFKNSCSEELFLILVCLTYWRTHNLLILSS
jgi:hypothetical protein